jgi:hypothetical protein
MSRIREWERGLDTANPWARMEPRLRLIRAGIIMLELGIVGGLGGWLFYRATKDAAAPVILGAVTAYALGFFAHVMMAPRKAVSNYLRLTRWLGVVLLVGFGVFLVALSR